MGTTQERDHRSLLRSQARGNAEENNADYEGEIRVSGNVLMAFHNSNDSRAYCSAAKTNILQNSRLGAYRSMPTIPSGSMQIRKAGDDSWRARIPSSSSMQEKGHDRKSRKKLPEMSHIQVGCDYFKTFLHPKAFKCLPQEPKYLLHLLLSEKCARATFQVFSYIR